VSRMAAGGRKARRSRWIFEVGGADEGLGPDFDSSPLEEALSGLDVTLTDRETELSGSSVLVYCLAVESAADEYLARIERAYPAPRFRVTSRLEKPRKRTTAAQRVKPLPGDVFAVPLPHRQYGYVWMVQEVPEYGAHAVAFLDLITAERLASIEECEAAPTMLAPLVTAVDVGLRVFGWVRVGNLQCPAPPLRFRRSFMHAITGDNFHEDWEVWEVGVGWQFVGALTDSMRRLPLDACYGLRVISGEIAKEKGIPDDGSLGVDLALWVVR